MAKRKRQINQTEATPILHQFMRPASIKELVPIFRVKRDMLRKWLKNQTIKNYQHSDRLWCVAIEELPVELVVNVLKKEQLSPREEAKILQQVKWSEPKSMGELCVMCGGVHRNTMGKWLKDQVYKNQKLSSRLWRIAKEHLPHEMFINVLLEMNLARIHGKAEKQADLLVTK